jgi:hypothetical protein
VNAFTNDLEPGPPAPAKHRRATPVIMIVIMKVFGVHDAFWLHDHDRVCAFCRRVRGRSAGAAPEVLGGGAQGRLQEA